MASAPHFSDTQRLTDTDSTLIQIFGGHADILIERMAVSTVHTDPDVEKSTFGCSAFLTERRERVEGKVLQARFWVAGVEKSCRA